MITILRKLRKSVFSKNKFFSYLLYAIGEIILVVIGILVALQINAWNQEQEDREELSRIMLSISANISSDINAIQIIISDNDTSINYFDFR